MLPAVPHGRCRDAVEAAERYADGLATDRELEQLYGRVCSMVADLRRRVHRGRLVLSGGVHPQTRRLSFIANTCHVHRPFLIGRLKAVAADAELAATAPDVLRCVFGDTLSAATFDPSWRTEATVGLAAGIYDERAFERLPILADALEEAGCEDEAILSHCREPGVHVRGCWVVDLVLGKG